MESLVEKLKQAGILTKDKIKRAADRQWKQGGTLLKNLVELKLINEEDVIDFFSRSLGIHVVNLREIEIDPEVIHYVPRRIAVKYWLIPIKRTRKTLVLAMANPLSKKAIKELSWVTDLEIIPLGARLSEVRSAIEIYYGKQEPPLEFDAFFIRPSENLTYDVLDTSQEEISIIIKELNAFIHGTQKSVLLIGAEGSGKTHLLHATAHQFYQNDPHQGILITRGSLLRDLLYELEEIGLYPQFRSYYKKHGVLLIDDIEPLKDAPRFGEFLEDYILQNKQIMLTSVKDPSEIGFHNYVLRRLLEFKRIRIKQPIRELVRNKNVAISEGEEVRLSAEEFDTEGHDLIDKLREFLHSHGLSEEETSRALRIVKGATFLPTNSTELETHDFEDLTDLCEKKGVHLEVTREAIARVPEWFLKGVSEIIKIILNAAEPGDLIMINFTETKDSYIAELEAKPILLIINQEKVGEIFALKEVHMEHIDNGETAILKISVEKR